MGEAVESDDGPEMDPDEPQAVESRWRRLVEYVHYNGDQMMVDVTILLAWLLGTTTVSGILGLPEWLHYIVLFIGIVAYSQVTPTWRRPYESPD